MVDTNQCKMAYDDNEEEYADFYDYSPMEAEQGEGECSLPSIFFLVQEECVDFFRLLAQGGGAGRG